MPEYAEHREAMATKLATVADALADMHAYWAGHNLADHFLSGDEWPFDRSLDDLTADVQHAVEVIREANTLAAEHEPDMNDDAEHGPVPATWFGVGRWPTCQCGYAPRDNGKLTAHWRLFGFEVVDDHGKLVTRSIED